MRLRPLLCFIMWFVASEATAPRTTDWAAPCRPARCRQVHWCMVLSSPTATMWSILDPNHLTWYVSCARALYQTRGRSLLVRLSQWGQSFYIFLKRKQSFKVHIHLLELAQFEFLRQILLITLFVLINLLPKFFKLIKHITWLARFGAKIQIGAIPTSVYELWKTVFSLNWLMIWK